MEHAIVYPPENAVGKGKLQIAQSQRSKGRHVFFILMLPQAENYFGAVNRKFYGEKQLGKLPVPSANGVQCPEECFLLKSTASGEQF